MVQALKYDSDRNTSIMWQIKQFSFNAEVVFLRCHFTPLKSFITLHLPVPANFVRS